MEEQLIKPRNPRTISEKKCVRIRSQKVIKGDKYTIPRVRYKYKPVSWEVFMSNIYDGYKTVRSSFIPYIIKNNEKYWILGSFHDFPKDILMDFGGSCIIWDPPKKSRHRERRRYYQHQFGCAMLELNEESKGLLVKPVLRSLGEKTPIIYRGTDFNRKEDVWFVMVKLDYDDLKGIGKEFDEAPYVLKGEKLGPVDFYRESDIIDPDGKYRTSRNLTDFIDYYRLL